MRATDWDTEMQRWGEQELQEERRAFLLDWYSHASDSLRYTLQQMSRKGATLHDQWP